MYNNKKRLKICSKTINKPTLCYNYEIMNCEEKTGK